MSTNHPRLIPIADWPKHHAWPPVGGLRHMKNKAPGNGFGPAFVKIGQRVLVDEERFFECVAERQAHLEEQPDDSPVTH